MAPKSPRKVKKASKKVKKTKRALITMPVSDSDEEMQPAAPVSEGEEEGDDAGPPKRPRLEDVIGEPTSSSRPAATVSRPPPSPPRPTATQASAATLSAGEEEEDSHPVSKKSVADSLTAEQEQKLVDFFASNPIFYDQTLKEFMDKGRRDHLLTTIGSELGLTSK